MADSMLTKRALAQALKQELKEKPFAKISIGDICGRCDMNRKSFYYHFHDKYDLVNWIFETEFRAAHPDFTDPWPAIAELCGYFYENREFYRKVLRVKGQNSFGEYFHSLCLAAFARKLGSDEQARFQAVFFADASLCAIERWLCERDCTSPEVFIARLRHCFYPCFSE